MPALRLQLFGLLALAACQSPVIEEPAPRYEGPIIDVHGHVFFDEAQAKAMNPALPAVPENLIASARAAKLERCGAIVMAKKGALEETRRLNDQVFALAQDEPMMFPIGSVHPEDGEAALAELERLAGRGFKVIKLHPTSQGFDAGSPAVAAVVKKSAELGLALLFDGWSPFDADQTGKFVKLAVANPKARLILAHMGGARFKDMLVFAVLKMYPWYTRNVWFDLSATAHLFASSPYAEEVVWVARQLGTDRVLFGSDFPLVTPEQAIRDVRALGFTIAEQRAIFYDNAAALLK